MAEMKGKDVNECIWPFFDNGLLLKIVDFYIEKQAFDKPKLLEQKLKLHSFTMMNENARLV